ncbi:MAG: SNF2-related protein [Verrucomicrobiales bacterium]
MPGQRWASETQPELGLGLVVRADNARVQVHFPAAGEMLTYASRGAPLRRVAFAEGDAIKSHEGHSMRVAAVREEKGLLVYADESGAEMPETALSDTISFQKPEARLLARQVDDLRTWDLRQQALRHRHKSRFRWTRGLAGGRISLIPHQLYIASEVANRVRARVLLADEVGLGKTIEACLILHRLHLAGRAQRILILVPEPLVHQWFVELLRRFQLSFKIFDEERADSIETEQPDANPFLEDQLVLCAVSWLADHPNRAAQAAEAGWDLAIVDEAHHLEWTPEAASPAYQAVAAIAEKTPGLLLLTATPEQLGREGHFARLRLLDPDRFSDLGEFLKESERYAEISKLADQLLSGDKLPKKSLKLVEELLGAEAVPVAESDVVYREEGDSSLEDGDEEDGEGEAPEKQDAADDSGSEESESVGEADPEAGAETEAEADAGEEAEEPESEPAAEPKTRADLARALIDLHGTGRVLFRNRRAVLQGFPKRIAEPAPVKDEDGAKLRWLAELLRAHPEEKFVLICATRELAESVEEGLREQISAGAGLFHEGLTLVQRDRNAAWFAQEDGARILICSEIGSEGRNFQFAHHLVLYDLPPDPALLEQRIGRLDRIGQTADIHIHIPYRKGTAEEFWMRWYHEGLGAFENTLHGSAAILARNRRGCRSEAARRNPGPPREGGHQEDAGAQEEVDKELESGRDHLLEDSLIRPRERRDARREDRGGKDADPTLEEFMLQMFDLFSVTVDDLEALAATSCSRSISSAPMRSPGCLRTGCR